MDASVSTQETTGLYGRFSQHAGDYRTVWTFQSAHRRLQDCMDASVSTQETTGLYGCFSQHAGDYRTVWMLQSAHRRLQDCMDVEHDYDLVGHAYIQKYNYVILISLHFQL